MSKLMIEVLEKAIALADAVTDADILSWGTKFPTDRPDRLRAEFQAALATLRQQPVQVDGIGIMARLRAEAAAAGSVSALAVKIGIKRQSLDDVMSARRDAGPAILSYLKMRKCGGRTFYTPIDVDAGISPAEQRMVDARRRLELRRKAA